MNYNPFWYGSLTLKNAPEVERLLRELLTSKRFTTVAYHPGEAGWRCQVETSQKLHKPLPGEPAPVRIDVKDGMAFGCISTTYGLWLFDSKEPENERIRNKVVGEKERYKVPYFVFEGNKVSIFHRAPCGDLLCWIFKQEHEEDAEGGSAGGLRAACRGGAGLMAFKVKPTKAMAAVLQKMADGYELHMVHHTRPLSTSAFLSGKSSGMIYVRYDYIYKFSDWGWIVMTSDPIRASYAGATYKITQAGRDALAGGYAVNKRRILVVDDDRDIRESMARAFQLRGLDVVTAVDGLEGLRLFRDASEGHLGQEPFDYVLTDYQMPRKNGVVMCMDIRELDCPQPLIVLISADPPRMPKEVAGIPVLTKPVRVLDIVAAFGMELCDL